MGSDSFGKKKKTGMTWVQFPDKTQRTVTAGTNVTKFKCANGLKKTTMI